MDGFTHHTPQSVLAPGRGTRPPATPGRSTCPRWSRPATGGRGTPAPGRAPDPAPPPGDGNPSVSLSWRQDVRLDARATSSCWLADMADGRMEQKVLVTESGTPPVQYVLLHGVAARRGGRGR
eukprot:1175644-Prorocentrum_minimum.AAC.2